MVKINDRFSFESDGKQWILSESKPGIGKNKEPIVSIKNTYHGTLLQVCSSIIDKSCANCGSAISIVAAIKQAEDALKSQIAAMD